MNTNLLIVDFTRRAIWLALLGASLATIVASPVWAAPITDLRNTGVDATGTFLLGASVPDPNYTLVISPVGTALPAVVTPPGYPFPAWVANTSVSQWIGPRSISANGPGGTYQYDTQFTLPPNADLNSVLISGQWATDNPGHDILVNGISTGNTNVIQFSAFTPFSISAPTNGPFFHGINTLSFVLSNVSGPTGLHVGFLQGSYAIPEPSGIALMMSGIVALGCVRRRRKSDDPIDQPNTHNDSSSILSISRKSSFWGPLSSIAAILVTCSMTQVSQAQLLNGSFETGTMYAGPPNVSTSGTPAPWIPTALTPDGFDNNGVDGWPIWTGITTFGGIFQGFPAASGDRFLGLIAADVPGAIFNEAFGQATAPLVGGMPYTISAMLAADDFGKGSIQHGGPFTGRGEVDVYLNSNLIGTLTQNTATYQWEPRSFSFIAPIAATAFFEFVAQTDPNTGAPSYIGIDAIEMHFVPEPSALSISLLSLGSLILRRRRELYSCM